MTDSKKSGIDSWVDQVAGDVRSPRVNFHSLPGMLSSWRVTETRLRLRERLSRWKCRWIDLFDASSRPVTAGPIIPSASSARLSVSEKLIVVDPRRASLVDDDFSIDDDSLNIPPAAILHQSVDRVSHRPIACRSQVDDDNVCLGTWRQSS